MVPRELCTGTTFCQVSEFYNLLSLSSIFDKNGVYHYVLVVLGIDISDKVPSERKCA